MQAVPLIFPDTEVESESTSPHVDELDFHSVCVECADKDANISDLKREILEMKRLHSLKIQSLENKIVVLGDKCSESAKKIQDIHKRYDEKAVMVNSLVSLVEEMKESKRYFSNDIPNVRNHGFSCLFHNVYNILSNIFRPLIWKKLSTVFVMESNQKSLTQRMFVHFAFLCTFIVLEPTSLFE